MHRFGIAVGVVVVLAVVARAPAPARVADRAAGCGSVPHAHGWRTQPVGAIRVGAAATALALAPGGRATALWMDRGGARVARFAGHWKRGRTLDRKAEGFDSSWVAASPGGALVAGWRSSPTGNDATISVLAGRAGAALGRPRIVSHDTRHLDLVGVPAAAVAADGGAVVAWIDRRPVVATSVIATRQPGAARFGSAFSPGITADAVAAGRGGRGLLASIALGRSGFSTDVAEGVPGQRWTVASQAAEFPKSVGLLVGAAVGPGGEAIIVARGNAELWATTRASAADVFTPARPISTRAEITEAVLRAKPSGGATVAWVERHGAAGFGRVRIADAPAGGPFGRPATFRGVAVTPRHLSLATLDNGAALASWTLDCGNHETKVLVGRRSARGAVSEPRAISDPRAQPVPPAAAIDQTGRMGVLWATRRPSRRPEFRVSFK